MKGRTKKERKVSWKNANTHTDILMDFLDIFLQLVQEDALFIFDRSILQEKFF